MAVNEQAQTTIFDKTIESPEVEEAIETLMAAKAYAKEHEVGKAQKLVKALAEQYDLQDGERLRCGAYVITGKRRGGGGFEVPVWEKTGVGRIDSLNEE